RGSKRVGAALRYGLAHVHPTSCRSGELRVGPLAKDRPGAHLSAGAAAAQGGGTVDGRATCPLGTPPRSVGQLSERSEGEGRVTLVNAIPDPRFDLLLERVVDVRPELVWAAWTVPEHVKKWFTPAPWQTVDCEIDLRPGGIFRTLMRSPEGQEINNVGCLLEIVPNRRLVWPVALRPASLPSNPTFDIPTFTAII